MAHNPDNQHSAAAEPRGFGEHTRRSSSEHAHEQGWGLNEDERRSIPPAQLRRGGTDYAYGAQDFGDTPADTRTTAASAANSTRSELENVRGEADRQRPARRKTA
jgi:hypothetical protein